MSAQDLDQKIQEVYKRIQTERKVIQASEGLRRATGNVEVQRQTDAQIKESQRSLSYFEDTLRELQTRKLQLQQHPQSQGQPSASPGPSPRTPGHRSQHSLDGRSPQGLPPTPRGWSDRDRALPPPPQEENATSPGDSPYALDVNPKPKPYTNLDLIKADTPYSTAKINRMLQQLEFKHQVELQYRKAIEQMLKLYQVEGDKKSRLETESKRVESERKIRIFQQALKRYRNLHILDDATDDEAVQNPAEGERKDNLRKPLSGKLQITIREARELDHLPPPIKSSRSSKAHQVDSFVVIKVEGTARATSHPSRTDRWNDEFDITVDKANEVEIAVYDKQGTDHPVPIGLLWIRMSDIVEALRKQRVGNEQGPGWVAAGDMGRGGGPGHSSGPGDAFDGMNADFMRPPDQPGYSGGGGGGRPGDAQEGIFGWFAVEPAGALALNINFIKENVRRRPYDAVGGLGRQGAVKIRRGQVHEMNGHKFIQRQFYQIMLCAFCSEFLLKAFGYQCEDCRYTCHKECYQKVVTKCISKSTAESEADEDKINHRIPHRFETITNIRANWCCHCGYMLPLGRKNAKKCTECDITCHATCAHLVPDFCGMSMETANQLLRQIQDIKSHQKQSQSQKPSIQYTSTKPTSPQYGGMPGKPTGTSMDTLGAGMEKMSMAPGAPPGASPPYSPHIPPSGAPVVDPRRTSAQNQYPGPGAGGVGTGGLYSPYPAPTKPGLPQTGGTPAPGPGPAFPEATTPGPGPGTYAPRPTSGYDRPTSSAYEIPPAIPPPRHDSYPSGRPHVESPVTRPPDRTSTAGYPSSGGAPPSAPPPTGPPPASRPPPETAPPPQPPQQQAIQKPRRKVGLDDFNFLAVLGKGNFGKVMLAEEKKTNGLYAIKVLKKEFIIDNDEVESTRSEKRVFLAAARERHPFLLGLHSCFQTETRVYFVMEYVSGGDLMLHIQRKQFSLRQAKFYAAEVLLALEYFHANGIIYRDLKLDNILLTLDGHVKVADYGLCKEEMWYGQTTSTFCGTPEFMAPEILLEQRYGRAVDWWAFGVLTYEMLLGQSPFRGDDEDEIFDAILEDEPLYPITMPRDAVSILQKLLTRDPTRRLGSGKTDAQEIKQHPFFKDTNWDDVINKRIPPPYYPTISNPSDVSNFDQEFTREQPTLTPVHGQLSAQDQSEFQGFSWVASWADI